MWKKLLYQELEVFPEGSKIAHMKNFPSAKFKTEDELPDLVEYDYELVERNHIVKVISRKEIYVPWLAYAKLKYLCFKTDQEILDIVLNKKKYFI